MANIGIISIGDMGAGVARLLVAHKYRVLTNVSDRSELTQQRARNAGVHLLPSDTDLVAQSDYIFSIVPPKDARATAERIIIAHAAVSGSRNPSEPLWFLDLNAIAPSTARSIAAEFASRAPAIRFVDGGIIGGPPKASTAEDGTSKWNVPSIPLSGPHALASAPKAGASIAQLLNSRHVGDDVGSASGLKCCFASLTKGYTALAIQSFSTASQLGVMDDLQDYIGKHAGAPRLAQTERSLLGMSPKAGRWVEEMREIGRTFEEEGGWESGEGAFSRIAGVYEFVSEGTVLGKEHMDNRVRGKTVEDTVAALAEGLNERKEQKKA